MIKYGKQWKASNHVTDALGFGEIAFRYAYKNTQKGTKMRRLMVWSAQAAAWVFVYYKWQVFKAGMAAVKIPWQVVAIILAGKN